MLIAISDNTIVRAEQIISIKCRPGRSTDYPFDLIVKVQDDDTYMLGHTTKENCLSEANRIMEEVNSSCEVAEK